MNYEMYKNLTEHQHQVLLVNYLEKYMPDLVFYAIPNGGIRDKRTASLLKREGVKAGVPDLHFPNLNLYVEMKKIGGRISIAQKEMINLLTTAGCKVAVCQGYEEAVNVITSNLKL